MIRKRSFAKPTGNYPPFITVCLHGVTITVPNPYGEHKHKVFERALQRYGKQISLMES